MSGPIQIGFSQRIQLGWLERTASLLFMGHTRNEIQAALQELLRDQLSVGGTAQRGNREKAISILLKIWVTIPKGVELFRDEGLAHLNRLPLADHLAVHWGMTIAVYPFVSIVAEAVGRLLRLQGSCAAVQVQRRVREQLGERETVARAARRVLRCFIDWSVLQETKEKGVYQAAPVRSVTDKKLATWLIEAALLATPSNVLPLKALTQSPMLFPFSIGPLSMGNLGGHNRLEGFRQGLDEEMVMFRSRGAFR
ncbi:MAG: hypothetical protein ACRERE_32505 [Candidatus Entotheonellia bacterium]